MANHNNFLEINYSRKIKLSAPTIFLKINHCLDPSRAGPGPVQAGLQPRASKKGGPKKKLPHVCCPPCTVFVIIVFFCPLSF